MATATNDKPVRLGDLPVVKTNILENARQYDKGVVGGYSGTFPLTAASQGGIYLLPSTGKFYVCETDYNGAQISAPNSNFVELSVWKNHDRLSNLVEINGHKNLVIKVGKAYNPENEVYTDIKFDSPFPNKCLAIIPIEDINTNSIIKNICIDSDYTNINGGRICHSEYILNFYYIAIGY